jgi:predicted DNA-binding transcriptional regulator AlpA
MIKIPDIKEKINESGLKNEWIMKKLDISRGTFYTRLKQKEFKQKEIFTLKKIGVL